MYNYINNLVQNTVFSHSAIILNVHCVSVHCHIILKLEWFVNITIQQPWSDDFQIDFRISENPKILVIFEIPLPEIQPTFSVVLILLFLLLIFLMFLSVYCMKDSH